MKTHVRLVAALATLVAIGQVSLGSWQRPSTAPGTPTARASVGIETVAPVPRPIVELVAIDEVQTTVEGPLLDGAEPTGGARPRPRRQDVHLPTVPTGGIRLGHLASSANAPPTG